ncbi:hypothetical protein MLD38_034097 [Melastoma candidum]|uniref:Uncharacterized protein n=1 Tax=Melastoma candidum TaxID=119954 RepID=A0ACB9M8J0_9MYRT|nr:hypothetical protein MLD38_034097 [Melastoma candidum]
MQRFTVPQRLFLYIYISGVVWTSLLVVASWIYAHNMEAFFPDPFPYTATTVGDLTKGLHLPMLRHIYEVWKSVFLLLLMEIQVLRRLFESMLVFNYSPSARMHITGYLIGVSYYLGALLSLFCNILPESFTYWTNIFSKMQPVEFNLRESVVPLIMLGWYQWIGTSIFIWGWIHQHRWHKILGRGSFRKNGARSNKDMIPYGDWFKIVSCPHCLAEIVIYVGLFVASGASDVTVFLLLIFVRVASGVRWPDANLTFAASETHRWYKRMFENYPPNRYAIIPYVF